MALRRIIAALVAALLGPLAALAADISPEVIDRAMASTVFLRATRVFKNETFPTSGSGFFIHPDGFILTNWHVIADQVETDLWGRDREVSAKVLKLTAVVHSGTAEEREIPVKIVARDRSRDLALLQVHYRPQAWIDFNELEDVRVGDRIWTVGFPFGEFLAMERSAVPGEHAFPEVSISAGMVTSLRRDADGRLAMVQTDAAVNPGNSGGPMINADGALVGVIFSKVQGASGIGFGVSPERIRAFLRRQAVKISFSPGTVLSPPQPIEVSVEPILVELAADAGEVVFEGDDIRPLRVPLTATATGLGATIVFPERIAGAERPLRYEATVKLRVPGNARPISRRFRLDAVPESFETLKSARDPGQMMEDRKVFSHEMRITDYASQGTGEQKRLTDVAGDLKLQRDARGTVVVDNRAVEEVRRDSVNPELYERIENADLRTVAQEQDAQCTEQAAVERDFELAQRAGSAADWKYVEQLRGRLGELRSATSARRTRLQSAGYCRCPNSFWYKKQVTPCGAVECSAGCPAGS